MPFPISELIQKQYLETIPRRATLREAFEIMGDHDYSQLPVVDEGGLLAGWSPNSRSSMPTGWQAGRAACSNWSATTAC